MIEFTDQDIKKINLINEAKKIVIIQAENPDGDSLGSSVALEEILSELGKEVFLHCSVDIPRYLHYIQGWDRVRNDFDYGADLAIIVDTSSDVLIGKSLEIPAVRNFLETKPVLVLDHHTNNSDLSFSHEIINKTVCATGELIFNIAKNQNWRINKKAANSIVVSVMSDSLGLTTENVNSETFICISELVKCGANIPNIEKNRRELMKKSPEILKYKGELISRVEYLLNQKLALIHIPWDEIKTYSDQYNPGALIGDELRLVEKVVLSIVIKTYPDGKITARIRSNEPISDIIAGYFGGGGHPYAAGFRVYDNYEKVYKEIIDITHKTLEKVENEDLQQLN